MGLFGGKKTYVTSAVYNLAGDEEDRPNFLKSLVVGNVIGDPGFDMSDTIQGGYINGPGIKLRSFARWSQGEYSQVMGATTSKLSGADDFNVTVVATNIPHNSDETVWIQRSDIGRAEIDWWSDRYMLTNHKDLFDQDWASDLDELNNVVYVRLPDGTMESFVPEDYDPKADYVYAAYTKNHTEAYIGDPGDPDADPPIPPTGPWTEEVFSRLTIFIYRIGSGNTELDALLYSQNYENTYLPVIPVRIDNKFVGPDKDQWDISSLPEGATDDEIDAAFKAAKEAKPVGELPINYPELFPWAKKALTRSVGSKFDKITSSVAKNASLKDIDFAYVVFGANLNTKENAAQEYLWRFFSSILETQEARDVNSYLTDLADYTAKFDVWKEWMDGGQIGDQPEKPILPTLTMNDIRVSAKGGVSDLNYDIQIKWAAIARSSGTGLGKPLATKGDVWWDVNADIEYDAVLYNPDATYNVEDIRKLEHVTLYKQTTDDGWEAISFWDLVHHNWIYNGKYVETKAKEAIQDTEESGFLVPLHYQTFREMSLVDSTQMGTACAYLVLNCYKIVKQKWYQTLAFKIFLIVAIIAVTVATGGFAAGGAGLLGTNAAVGASIGLTGTAATIAGVVANAFAAMLLMKALGYIAVAALGEKVGAIVAAVTAMVAMTVGVGALNGSSFSAALAQMARPENLLRLTEATMNGVSGYVKASMIEMQEELGALKTETDEKLKEIHDLYEKNIGYGRGTFDPMGFVGLGAYTPETSSAFLSRTLMVGSDVIGFGQSLITDFSTLTLSTELPS